MIGRDHELALMNTLVSTTQDQGRAVVIAGEAGIGKSTLAEETARMARAAGFQELRCSGRQQVAASGYEGLRDLLHPVISVADTLPARQRTALMAAFGDDGTATPDRFLTSLAALGLLEEVAAHQPLLIVVEDLQWLDHSSATVVQFLARRLSNAPILLVMTLRTDSPFADVAWLPSEDVLVLGPLDQEQSGELLDASGGPASGWLRQRVLEEAAGNPLALRELPTALAGLHVDGGPPPEMLLQRLPVTQRLEATFVSEAENLPEGSRRLLLLAAAGADLPMPQLAAAARLAGLTGLSGLGGQRYRSDDLTPLERSGLLTVREGRYHFRHPLVPSAIYSAATAAQRAEAHHLLASAALDPARAAWHKAAVADGPDEVVAAALVGAGEEALRRGARAEAATAFHRAAQLSPSTEDRVERLARAAETARQAGRNHFATQVLREAVPLATSAFTVSELASSEVGLDVMAGIPARSAESLLATARQLAGPERGDAGMERTHLLWAVAVLCASRPHPDHVKQAVAAELLAVDPGAALPSQQTALAMLDPLTHAPALLPQMPALLPLISTDLRVQRTLGAAAEALHDMPTAMAAWVASRDQLHRVGASADEAQVLTSLARLNVTFGDLTSAVDNAELALRLAAESEMGPVMAIAYAAAALAHAWRGDIEAASTAVRLSRQPAGAPRLHETAVASWAAGLAALGQGDHRSAWLELQGTTVHPWTGPWAVADLTEAAVHCGQEAVAHRAVDAVERAAARVGSPYLWTLVHRSRALLSDDEEAERYFQASIEYGHTSAAILETARSRLAYGEWLRRRRRPLDARTHLEEALHVFEAQGARPWAERARGELRASGAARSLVNAASSVEEILTSQERQIAELAALGLTNKQIGDHLYLSHRTVSSHLYRVFPKLGISNRQQLAQVMPPARETTKF